MILLSLALLAGFLMLFKSADQFVIGAIATARNFQISPMFIGLTVVALGTSAPEIFVAATSSLQGQAELAVGNAIGSNIANIGMVLGFTALLVPLPIRVDVRRNDMPVLIIVTLCAGASLIDLYLGVWDGLLLFAGLGLFLYRLAATQMRTSSMEIAADISEIEEVPAYSTRKATGILLTSLVFLLISAELLVWTVTEIAIRLEISEMIIGLTVIAVGTSLPELVVSVTSALKGQTDLAIGNIVGSNIFNILAVLSIPSLLSPTPFSPELLWRDYALMLLMTGMLVYFAYNRSSHYRITRFEGSLLLIGWLVYLVALYRSAVT